MPVIVEEGDFTPPPSPDGAKPDAAEGDPPVDAEPDAAEVDPPVAADEDDDEPEDGDDAEGPTARKPARPPRPTPPPARCPARERKAGPSGVRPMVRLVSILFFFRAFMMPFCYLFSLIILFFISV